MSNEWIIVEGNPVTGLAFTGPFGSLAAAIAFATTHVSRTADWWITAIDSPEDVIEANRPLQRFVEDGGE